MYGNNFYKGQYFSAMDGPEAHGSSGGSYVPMGDELQAVDVMEGFSPADIGISAPPMQNQLEALQAKIRQGAKRVELGFMGRGKGSMGQGSTTPEMYGMEERRDMKELAELNRVILSTHATPAIGNVSGLTEGGFNEMAREQAFNEIRRAIDFAADVTPGGAVVLHTGEFQRPIYDNYPDFQMYPTEAGEGTESSEKKAVHHIVDKRTGQIIPVRTDQPVQLPVWKLNDKGDFELDENKQRIPETDIDPETGLRTFKIETKYWKYFVDLAERKNKQNPDNPTTAALEYHKEQLTIQKLQYSALSHFYGGVDQYEETQKTLKRMEDELKYQEKYEAALSDEDKEKIKQPIPMRTRGLSPEFALPSENMKAEIREMQGRLQHLKFGAMTYTQQSEQLNQTMANLVPIKDYAVQKSADTIARAGLFAMAKSEQAHLKEPLYVAPENIFPETYGSHPDELRTLIIESRKSMATELKAKGFSQGQADDLAKEHIKATFDTGHGYTWRKYYRGDPGASIAENDAKFKTWLLDKVEALTKEGIIGHVHVSDNFGYEDEHVDPGMGKVPIKEMVERFKKHGINHVIVEPAHQDYRALLSGWRHFGSSIYGASRPGGETWSDVWRGYFGRNTPPYFIYQHQTRRTGYYGLELGWSNIFLHYSIFYCSKQ
jgi:sugar phosphate isomerase/epimerase